MIGRLIAVNLAFAAGLVIFVAYPVVTGLLLIGWFPALLIAEVTR